MGCNVDKNQYQIRALRQSEGDNLQLKVILGLIVSLAVAGATSPIAGLVLASWVWWRSAKEANESGRNSQAILDGTFAHSLDEDDFRDYSTLVGEDQIKSEIEVAIARKLPLSNHVKQVAKTLISTAQPVLRGAEPVASEPIVVDTFETDKKVQSSPKFKDPEIEPEFDVESLVQPLDNMFVLGCGGAGKGVLVSNLLRLAQRKDPGLKVFVIDPKGEELESGYWDSCDHVERNQVDKLDSVEVVQWLDKCFDKYLSWLSVVEQSGGRGLLIVDELLILGHHAKAQKYNKIGSLIIHLASLGDMAGRKVWLITQTPYVTGVGLTLSQSSQIPWVCLIGSSNPLRSWGKAATLAPISAEQLQKLKESSPVNRAIMVGDQWYPMPRLQNYSGVDRDSKKFNRGVMPLVLERVASNPTFKAWQNAIKTSGATTPEEFCTIHNITCTPAQLELIRECFYAQLSKSSLVLDGERPDVRTLVNSGSNDQRATVRFSGKSVGV